MVAQEQSVPGELIAKWIRPHPWRRGAADARLVAPQISVWALIGYLHMVGGDVGRVAEDYQIPLEAVEAALAYYDQHAAEIRARLTANAL